jgi:hypothetical protein
MAAILMTSEILRRMPLDADAEPIGWFSENGQSRAERAWTANDP